MEFSNIYKSRRPRGKRTIVISVLLVLGIIALICFSAYSIDRVMTRLDTMMEQPFPVIDSVSDLDNTMGSIRLEMASLRYNNTPTAVAALEERLDALYAQADVMLATINNHYVGSEASREHIADLLTEIHAEQQEMMAYAESGTRTAQEIDDYAAQRLFGLYTDFETETASIMNFSREQFRELYAQSRSIHYMYLTVTVISIIGLLVLALIAYRVIREQRRNLELQSELFDLLTATVDSVFMISNYKERGNDYLSSNCNRIFGLPEEIDDPDKLMDMIRTATDPNDAKRINELFVDRSGTYWHSSFRYTNPITGELRVFSFRSYRSEEISSDCFITVMDDQTEAQRARHELELAKQQAESSNRAKSSFLSRMSHEIRTPMNGIIGMTVIALQNSDNEDKVISCLRKISLSAKHLLTLINDVLDMNKIESNKIEIHKEEFNFKTFIEALTSVIYGQAKEKAIEFEVLLSADLADSYIGDQLRLNQIVMNLLSNALKFTPENGRVILRISVAEQREGETWLRFEVKDTGSGIAADKFDRIFAEFEQEDETIAAKYGGTGLGLPIAKRFTEMMGGTISLNSTIGRGSVFTVELPLEEVEQQNVAPLDLRSFQGLRAIVVDDDREICDYICLLLRRVGIVAEYADNGYEAISKVERAKDQSDPFDLCLIDWKMPYIDGLETTRRIRATEQDREMAVILISAYDTSEIETEAKEAGADEIISKPIFQSDLLDVLVNLQYSDHDFKKSESIVSSDFRGKRFLVVEDNAINLEIATELLNLTGATVETAANGREAVERFAASLVGYYDLILMDVQMPIMNGYDATRQIRALDRPDAITVRIYAMTANAFDEDVKLSLESGMDGHINKPIDPELMFRTIRSAFRENKSPLEYREDEGSGGDKDSMDKDSKDNE